MESRGLGQQLHVDASTNLLFHLHGDRQVILAPPDEVLRHAHLHPHFHPNSHGQPAQSQLAWSSEGWARSVSGYGLPQNEQTPPPRYDQTKETVAHLTGGDLLYVPAYWGQQTCAGMSEATISLSVALWPTAVGPDDRPQDRGPWGSVLNPEHPDSKRSERQNKALREALEKAVEGTQNAAEKWVRLLATFPAVTHIAPVAASLPRKCLTHSRGRCRGCSGSLAAAWRSICSTWRTRQQRSNCCENGGTNDGVRCSRRSRLIPRCQPMTLSAHLGQSQSPLAAFVSRRSRHFPSQFSEDKN